ncbi:MAG: diguanylate cyclase [Deltaproteobacteria bacterium]
MNTDIFLQYKIFLSVAPVTIVLLLFMAAMIYRARKTAPTAYSMMVLCVLVVGYIVCNSLEQVTTTPGGTLFFAKMTYLFLMAIPVFWIDLAWTYTDKDNRLRLSQILVLFLIPVISDVLVFTNEWHGLIWTSVAYVPLEGLLTMRVEHGFWFYIAASYNYLLLIVGSFMIFREFLQSLRIYRRQASWLLAGAVFPLVFNLIYLFGLIPGLVKDYTCFGFFFSVICFYIGIFRYRLLELLPIARATIIEQMRDGVVILNSDLTILDLNPQARRAIGQDANLIGQPFRVLEPLCPALYHACREMITRRTAGEPAAGAAPQIIGPPGAGEDRYFDIKCVPVIRGKVIVGHLITLHDVTEQVALWKRIEELARTDELTSLYNRRHFMEIYSHELERANRYKKPLALGILDIDFFKKVNDQYGHPAGDRVLARFGPTLRSALRDTDIVARLGGEEFGVLMPETHEQEAYKVFCRLKELIAKQEVMSSDLSFAADGECMISITVSIGIASREANDAIDNRALLERADRALYQSKNKGRNRVTVWDHSQP